MNETRILVIGACGQIGTELTAALRWKYGKEAVLAADRHPVTDIDLEQQPYVQLDVTDSRQLFSVVRAAGITQIYHLAAMLSASGEKNPQLAWEVNMNGLLNVLEVARLHKIEKLFWPSSIAVFGPSSPKEACPQQTVTEPSTVYGISKCAGEYWCQYYHEQHGLDVRSLRYPGLISYSAEPGGGTTDYAVAIYQEAIRNGAYTCYLSEDTKLPMMYMPDAIRATLELMEAPAEAITVRTAYNIAGMSFTPGEIAAMISRKISDFSIAYEPDFRQQIADSWPRSIDDTQAREDWGWQPAFELDTMTTDMLHHTAANTITNNEPVAEEVISALI